MDGSAPIVFRRHLREQAIAQAEWGIAKPRKAETLDQFAIDECSREDDLRTSRSEARKAFALFERELCQSIGDSREGRARDGDRLTMLDVFTSGGNASQCRGGARGRDGHLHFLLAHSSMQAIHFLRNELF